MCLHKACFSAKSGGLEGTGAAVGPLCGWRPRQDLDTGRSRAWPQPGGKSMEEASTGADRLSSNRDVFQKTEVKRINREWAKRGRCELVIFMKDDYHRFTREEKKNLTFHSMLMTSPSATLEAASQKILGNTFNFCVWLIVRGLRFTLLIIYINYLSLKLGFNLGRCICVPMHAFTKWRSAKKTYLVWYFQLFLEIINASNSTHQLISSLLFLSLKTSK